MERTGTNGRELLALLRQRGYALSAGHLSNILKGSRRCSLRMAVALNEVTDVPIKAIAEWPTVRNTRQNQSAA